MMSPSYLPACSTISPVSKIRACSAASTTPLLDIVLLTLCAVVSGADGWEAIEDFGREKLEWLRLFARFENGVPSHDCIANVISRLTPKDFGACFRSWTQAVTRATGGGSGFSRVSLACGDVWYLQIASKNQGNDHGPLSDDIGVGQTRTSIVPATLIGPVAAYALVDHFGTSVSDGQVVVEWDTLLNYFGHSGITALDHGLLTAADIAAMNNKDRMPFVVGITCLMNRFEFPRYISLGESLLLQPTGGAAAAWSSGGYSYTSQGVRLPSTRSGCRQTDTCGKSSACVHAEADRPACSRRRRSSGSVSGRLCRR
jgi:hypothetical protein